METIWSSAKILEFGTQSQLSQLQIQSHSHQLKIEKTSRHELNELLQNVAKPFRVMMKA